MMQGFEVYNHVCQSADKYEELQSLDDAELLSLSDYLINATDENSVMADVHGSVLIEIVRRWKDEQLKNEVGF